ncbi:MAG: type II toxin-antitoxin system VapC family toxin [Clostridia bacterium]|nr:type II toxin-antitoxin system VapC family toxin [Clostridia bacterium]
MYMLDTNILIYAMRHPEDQICERLIEHAAADLCVSAMTYAELELGVLRSSNPLRNRQALIAALSGMEIVDFGAKEAAVFARIKDALMRSGALIEDMDMLIGAHAMALGCTLVTNNTKHFGRIEGLICEDWLDR